MSLLLNRNQETSLQVLGMTSPIVVLGIGWQSKRKPGLLNRLANKYYETDLDLSCVVYDHQNEKMDTIWYAQLQSKCGGVRHRGDETEGDEKGDDETIMLDLNQLDEDAKTLFFVVSSFSGGRFSSVEHGYWRLFDPVAQREMARFKFSGNDKSSAKIILRLTRAANEVGVPYWQIKALDETATGKNIQEITPEIRELLGD